MKDYTFITLISLLLVFQSVIAQKEYRKSYQGVKIGAVEKEEEEIPETPEARQESLTKFFEEWAQHMGDFQASDLMYFHVNAGEQRVFYEDIDKVPSIIRGAYSVSAEQRNKIHFTIYDPDMNPIYMRSKVKEAIIYIQANKTGTYSLEFSNRNVFL